MTLRLHRRTLLRGALAGGVTGVALPILEAMLDSSGEALAGGEPLPKRLGVFYWGNGRADTGWTPNSDGAGGWLPSENLQPLADRGLAPDVSVVQMLNAGNATGCHVPARAMILAGSFNGTDQQVAELNPAVSLSNRPSFDQIAADHIGVGTLFPSLEVGISRVGFGGVEDTWSCSWRDANVLPAEMNPTALFDRVFAGFEPDDSIRQARLSVVDAIMADAEALHGRLGAPDKMRLESHLDGLRDLEVRIEAEPPVCEVPTRPAEMPDGTPEPILEKTQLFADLLAMALACDLTRVFTFRFTQCLGDTLLSDIGAAEGLHNISHVNMDVHRQTVTYTMERFADVLERMASVTEGAGRLLDNCAVLGVSELTVGSYHDVGDTPMLVAGGCGGALNTGLLVDGASQPAAALPLTLLQALDVPVTEIGEGTGMANQPLAELLA